MLPATNGGSKSNTFCIPSEIVVLFNQARHPQGLYSAVESGITFFSLSSFTLRFLLPSLAKPGTGAGADGGSWQLNVHDAIKSSDPSARMEIFRISPICFADCNNPLR